MSSDSFERNEIRELRELLNSMVLRIGRLERHVGLPQSAAIAETAETVLPVDDAVVLAEAVEDKPPVVLQPEIILSEVQEVKHAAADRAEEFFAKHSPAASESTIPETTQSARTTESLESLIGGRLFTWVGGVLLILATAFFVVWSWRNLDFPDWVRVAMMHSLGLAVIAGGTWFKDRMLELHSRVLYGVGIFGLYASALAMTHLYELGGEYREMLGFLDGVLITALAIGLSLRNKSVGIIILGAMGGYLTPLLTYKDSDPVVTFVYLAMLNIALLVSGHVGKWDFLKPMSWAITALIFAVAILTGAFETGFQGTSLLTLHAAIFLIATSLPHLIWKSQTSPVSNFVFAGSALGYLVGFAVMNRQPVETIATVCLLLTAMHGVICWFAFTRLHVSDRLGRISLALASLFLTFGLTIWFHESPQVWTTIWALEGLAFGLIGFAFRDRQMLFTSTAAFALTLLRAMVLDFGVGLEEALAGWWDPRTLRWLFFAAVMGFAGSGYWWVPRVAGAANAKSWLGKVKTRMFAEGFLAVANLLFLTAMYFQFRENLPILLTICALDVGFLSAIAFANHQKGLRHYAATLSVGLGVFAFGLMAWQSVELELWNNWSRVAFLTTSGVFLAAGWKYWTDRASFSDEAEKSVHAFLTTAGHVLLVGWLTGETRLFFSPDNGYSTLTAMTVCSGLWSIYAAALLSAGYRVDYTVMRVLGLILFGVTALMAFAQIMQMYDEGLSESWDLLSRCSNLLAAGLLIGFGLAYWLKRKLVTSDFEQQVHGFLTVAGHALMLAILSVEVLVFFGSGEGARTTTELATYSVVWGVYAALLVASGFLLRYPLPRFLGIGVFILVLIKVFLVDLGQVELIIRVVALMILGLLLLGISLLYQKFKTRIEGGEGAG